jgi:hypothetical protein
MTFETAFVASEAGRLGRNYELQNAPTEAAVWVGEGR